MSHEAHCWELVIVKPEAFDSLWPDLWHAPSGQALSEKKPWLFPGLAR